MYIVPNVSAVCNGNGTYEALNSLSQIQTIQTNLNSGYMKASDIFVLLMMLLTAFFACIYIPFSINEYGTPIYFRDSFSNIFLDFLRLRIFAFAYFMAMSGCLPHFNFYITDRDHYCLFSNRLSIAQVDAYQFILTFLVWTVMIPTFSFLGLNLMRDNIKYTCIPVIIATAIFQVLIVVIAAIIIINVLISANTWYIRLCHIFNICVLVYCILIAALYKHYFSRRDLLKTEQEEI